MPHLLVNLEDRADCKKAVELLTRRLRRGCGPQGQGRRGMDLQGSDDAHEGGAGKRGRGKEDVASLPLPQKLKRIQSRGMWKHLLKIAQSAEQPLSLPELDELLGLSKNKMRSLKAIMAKLENRFELQFLKVDPDAGEDVSGNPRYMMPARIRRQILRLASA
ncbi:hypothetical protein [Novipirellula artificiosorum]|uniref:hypothetical protein n=1 Tax=Novipirellula artificiosorum TaxID=2528016 RepID=UPI0011B4712B|nr:hypothetical protein [Novipirellula artificiosorum]